MEPTRLARPWATSTTTAASPVEPAVSTPCLACCWCRRSRALGQTLWAKLFSGVKRGEKKEVVIELSASRSLLQLYVSVVVVAICF